MKTTKSAQILVVTGALGLLSSYVVYSQLQHAQTVLSGSKSGVLDMKPDYLSFTQTNTLRRGLQVAAPDFKGPDILSLTPASQDQPSTPAPGKRLMIAPGSKSMGVFLPHATGQRQQTVKVAETNRLGLVRVQPQASAQVARGALLSETNRNMAADVQTVWRTQQSTNVSHP